MTRRSLIRGLFFFLSLIVGIAVFWALIAKEGWSFILESLYDFGWLPFLGFLLLSLINFGLYSWRWQLIINAHPDQKKHLALHRVYLHRMAGFATSYLTPAAQVGGEPLRIGMLMGDGVSAKHSTSSVLIDVALELVVYISFIVCGVILALYDGNADGFSLEIIAVVLVIFLAILFGFFGAMARGRGYFTRLFRVFRLDKIKKFNKVYAFLKQTEELMTSFLHTAGYAKLGFIFFLALFVIGFRVFEVFYIAYFFGETLSFGQAFLVGTLPGVTLLMPIPASVGIFEGAFTAVFALLHIPISAVGFALIIRLRDAIFIFIGVTHGVRQGSILLNRRRAERKS